MDYKKIVEEQIELLKQKQKEKNCTVNELCQIATTITSLTQTASQLPKMKCK